MTFNLPEQIQSLSQLQTVKLELAEAEAAERRWDAKKRVGVKPAGTTADAISPELAALLKAWQATGQTSLSDLSERLNLLISHPIMVNVTLPTAAPPDFRKKVVNWFRAEIRPDLLVNFQVSPDLGGGLVIRTQNQVYDFSFRTRLIEAGQKIAGIVRRV